MNEVTESISDEFFECHSVLVMLIPWIRTDVVT